MSAKSTHVRLSAETVARLDAVRDGIMADQNGETREMLQGDAHRSGKAAGGISYDRLIAHLLDQRDRYKDRKARSSRRRKASYKRMKLKDALPDQ